MVCVGVYTNLPTVYTYGSLLETGSPRFSSPGDFFTYVFFVGTVIVVSYGLPCPFQCIVTFPLSCIHLTYLPAQPNLAEAVPGSEEDHPCISLSTHSHYHVLCALQVWW